MRGSSPCTTAARGRRRARRLAARPHGFEPQSHRMDLICSTRKHANGKIDYFHTVVAADPGKKSLENCEFFPRRFVRQARAGPSDTLDQIIEKAHRIVGSELDPKRDLIPPLATDRLDPAAVDSFYRCP